MDTMDKNNRERERIMGIVTKALDNQEEKRDVLKLAEGVVTPKMAGRILGVSYKTVHRLLESGELEGYRIGKQWRTTIDDLADYVKKAKNV